MSHAFLLYADDKDTVASSISSTTPSLCMCVCGCVCECVCVHMCMYVRVCACTHVGVYSCGRGLEGGSVQHGTSWKYQVEWKGLSSLDTHAAWLDHETLVRSTLVTSNPIPFLLSSFHDCPRVCLCAFVLMHACTCMYAYVSVLVCMCLYVYVRMCLCACVCVFV